MIGKAVSVTVDRPLGSRHPQYPDTVYKDIMRVRYPACNKGLMILIKTSK